MLNKKQGFLDVLHYSFFVPTVLVMFWLLVLGIVSCIIFSFIGGSFITSILSAIAGVTIILSPFFFTVVFFIELSRAILYKLGFRVYRKKELIDFGLVRPENGEVFKGTLKEFSVNLKDDVEVEVVGNDGDDFDSIMKRVDLLLDSVEKTGKRINSCKNKNKNQRRIS